MKPRRWVIVVCLCVLIAVTALFQGVRYLEKHKNIERLLVQQLSASTGGQFSVGRVRLGFFSVYLQDVRASLSTNSYNASVRDIKIAFSLWKLIVTRLNFGASISKIILISPTLTIRLSQSPAVAPRPPDSLLPAAAPPPPAGGAKILPAFKNFPVQYLLVRRGTVTLLTRGGAVVVGDELAGRVWDEPAAVMAELRGTVASNKRNLFLSAAFSKTGERHRVSLRLDKAQISRPFSAGGATVTAGVIDGVFELTFPDSVNARSIESNGWLRISRGKCTVKGLVTPITAIGFFASVSNTRVRLDSLQGELKGAQLSAKGSWDFAEYDSSENYLTIHAAGIRPDALTMLPAPVRKNLTETGWAEVKLGKRENVAQYWFSCSAGGVSVWGMPVTSLACCGRFDASQATVDTLNLYGGSCKASATGLVNYEKKPVAYTVTFNAGCDSLPGVPAVRGRIILQGNARGLGQSYYVDAMLGARSLSYNGIPLGGPQIRLTTTNGKGLAFSSLKGSSGYFSISGLVDSLGGARPLAAFTITLGSRLLREALARAQPGLAAAIDSAWAVLWFRGTASSFSARAQAGIAAAPRRGLPRIGGGLEIKLDKTEKESAARWQLAQRDFSVGDSVVPVWGCGMLSGDSLRIDSMAVLGSIRTSGEMRFGKAGGIYVVARYRDVSLAALNRLLFGKRLPVTAGALSGFTQISGPPDRLRTDSELHLRGGAMSALSAIETDMVLQTRDSVFTVLPLVIRQHGVALVTVDTVTNRNGLHFSGTLQDIDAASFLASLLPEDFAKDNHEIKGTIRGGFASSNAGRAAEVRIAADRLSLDGWHLDKIQASFAVDGCGIAVHSFSAHDSLRTTLSAGGTVPWTVLSNEENDSDTLDVHFMLSGDLLASLEHNAGIPLALPIAGHGQGTVELALGGTPGNVRVIKAAAEIPHGILRVKPFVPDDIKDFSLHMAIEKAAGADSASSDDQGSGTEATMITTLLKGTIARRPVEIRSTHTIPGGFEPLVLGPLDFGALLVTTPKRGVDIHVPGLQAIGAPADVEFAAKAPFPAFALSGPVDHLCITGTWILRTCDLTFPILDNVETRVKFDPFPYINWNLDLRVGNRNVMYYFDTGRKRNLMRLTELYFDPVSELSMRGRVLDNTFRLFKSLRSSKGWVFFGRTFDRNVDIGLDFVPELLPGRQGYNNLPIIWGSAEAMSDTSRFERVKITLLTRDSVTGAWSEHGRLYDIHFRVGSSIEQIPGESEKQFVSDEGKKYGSIEGAGEFVGTLGEQYLHRILLQNLERRLAKTLGLDVITVETSIASNYFNNLYTRQFEISRWDYLTFANVGITLGRYILYDKVFLKWRTELVPVDTLLRPEYQFGFEFQPMQYLLMDVNYGVHMGDNKALEGNPQVYLLLQLPIKDVRKLFSF
ncbi:MAG TPA: hypothetical protein VLX68_14445 [Chitinivibrionales bacterium]|nr:hypothetical protein [Chitinivibrionales bacterium]